MTYALPGMFKTSITATSYMGGTDSPFSRNRAVLDMVKGWEIMKAVTELSLIHI